jgi:phosphoglycolate phosphatase
MNVFGEAMSNGQGSLLLLWDIDGTLLSSDGAGRAAMAKAFLELFGVADALDGLELAGRTDEAILLEALEHAGRRASKDDLDRFKNRYYGLLQDELVSSRRSPRALPGVLEILETLKYRPRYVSGLLTGNWEISGYIKLSAVELDDQFGFGAFGGDAPTREDLLPLALERASELTGSIFPVARTVVIGDTPRDIAVAKVHGAKSVGVATGIHSLEELRKAGPHCVAKTMADPRILETLTIWLDGE